MEEFKIIRNLKKLKSFYLRFEKYFIPGALVLGFVVDLITFRFINFSTALILLFSYLFLATFCVGFILLRDSNPDQKKILSFIRFFSPLILQYSFGAILSGSIIFYSFSGSVFTNWPFILILILLFISNELFKEKYKNLVFRLSILFFVAFSLFILALPFVTRIIDFSMFILSGVLSLIFIFLFIRFLEKRSEEARHQKRKATIVITLIFILINIFYFTNTIPPFPLSLRDIGVCHSIERVQSGDYRLVLEKTRFLDKFSFYKTFKVTSSNQEAYVFSSVFSPAKLKAEIIHEWQYFDPNGKWLTLSKVSFPIVGGRKEGYRGYSKKDNVIPGKWRVNVKTKSGQTIGRTYIKVELVDQSPELEEKVI